MTSQTITQSDKTPTMRMEKKTSVDQRESFTGEDTSMETQLKQEVKRVIPISASGSEQATISENNMTSSIPPALTTSRYPSRATTEASETMRIPSQGRLSTLSSVVRPTPTTATRTVAITREESRLDALKLLED